MISFFLNFDFKRFEPYLSTKLNLCTKLFSNFLFFNTVSSKQKHLRSLVWSLVWSLVQLSRKKGLYFTFSFWQIKINIDIQSIDHSKILWPHCGKVALLWKVSSCTIYIHVHALTSSIDFIGLGYGCYIQMGPTHSTLFTTMCTF